MGFRALRAFEGWGLGFRVGFSGKVRVHAGVDSDAILIGCKLNFSTFGVLIG